MSIEIYESVRGPNLDGTVVAGDKRKLYVYTTLEELQSITTARQWETGVVGAANYRWNGSAWVATAGGGTGTTTVDFGAFPGASDASVDITGQVGILATSVVQAWITPVATADHSADEHMLETLKCFAGAIVAGVGFTVYVLNTNQIDEPAPAPTPPGTMQQSSATAVTWKAAVPGVRAATRAPRIYGQWTVAWRWT